MTSDYDQMQLVTFHLDGEDYAVPVQHVESIIKLTRPTKVPGAPAVVRGVSNLRGKVITVFDLRRRFGLPNLDDETEARVLVIHHDGRNTGVLVDAVSEVITLSADDVLKPPVDVSSGSMAIAGLCRWNDQLVIILDLGLVLDGEAGGVPSTEGFAVDEVPEATVVTQAIEEVIEPVVAEDEATGAQPAPVLG